MAPLRITAKAVSPLTPEQHKRAVEGQKKPKGREITATEAASMRRIVFPTFRTVDEERQHMKQRLAAAFRIFAEHGFDSGNAGHATFRDPEFEDCYWVNPIGVHFSDITVGDLCMLNQAGEMIVGNRPVLSATFAIHGGIYRKCPQVRAAVHTHSDHGVAFSTLGKLLDPISQDTCAFYNRQVLFGEFEGPVLDVSEGETYGKLINETGSRLVILQNHGLLTTGESVDEMAYSFIFADKCCKIQSKQTKRNPPTYQAPAHPRTVLQLLLMADAAGPTKKLSPHVAAQTSILYNPKFMWVQFQPLYYRLLKRDPSFLSEEESKGLEFTRHIPPRVTFGRVGVSAPAAPQLQMQAKARM
ncbi:hypothetical protein HDU93_006138 [Gonapodya sp. JEL0774]|nr:hypothetical protein HDU93_006138 [Gonapodya sp. JEL0774]